MFEFIDATWTWMLGTAGDVIATLDRARLLTPTQSIVVTVITLGVFSVTLVHVWMQRTDVQRRWEVVASCLAIPAAMFIMLQAHKGFAGTPDDNCQRYEDGKLVFTLLDMIEIPRSREDPYASEWLILVVRAPPRWGNEPHQCRLPLRDAKARAVRRQVAEQDGGGSNGIGETTFSFGAANEAPNVKIRGLPSLKKDGPPEVPPSKRGSA